MNGTTISRADRAALENLWGDAGGFVADTWTELNGRCFDGRLRYRGIVFGLTPHGRNHGHTSQETGRITLHPSLLDPRGDAWGISGDLGERYAADVLVHEMVHAWNFQQGRYDGEAHNSIEWCEEIARVTPLLGLPPIRVEPIRQRRIGGKVTRFVRDDYLTRRQLAAWPWSIRPADYYNGANGRIAVPI